MVELKCDYKDCENLRQIGKDHCSSHSTLWLFFQDGAEWTLLKRHPVGFPLAVGAMIGLFWMAGWL